MKNRASSVTVRFSSAVLIVSLVCCLGGCGGVSGPPRAAVQGDVSLDGSPLPSGVIRFVPTGKAKGPAALGVIKEGRFALPASHGPVLGPQIVEIDATLAEDPTTDATDVKAAWTEFAKTNESRPREITIPKRYNRTSTLRVEVTAQTTNAFDFKLASQ
jgi:hypothetical protein